MSATSSTEAVVRRIVRSVLAEVGWEAFRPADDRDEDRREVDVADAAARVSSATGATLLATGPFAGARSPGGAVRDRAAAAVRRPRDPLTGVTAPPWIVEGGGR